MKIIKCDLNYLDALAEFYDKVVDYLLATVNYPKWSKEYPCRSSIEAAINRSEQYACIDEDGKIAGAFVLNEDPQGSYEKGSWSKKLKDGEYEVVHTLAVNQGLKHKGIGSFMTEYIINDAKEKGYRGLRLDVVPGNTPAASLYMRYGFDFVGAYDLDRGFDDIPLFELYELNF